MNAVLRTTLAYFNILPIQRWFNGGALLLLAFGAIQFSGKNVGSGSAGFGFTLAGVILLTLMPAFGGGMALRFASTPTLLHLRPHGRSRVLLGATLTITLIAVLVSLPSLAIEWFMASLDLTPSARHVPPLEFFLNSWGVLAAGWVVIFILSRSMLAMAAMGLMPLLVMTLGQALGPVLPSAYWVFVPGLACWLAFAVWYLRTASVTRPVYPMSGSSDASTTPIGRYLAQFGATDGPVSRQQGLLQYVFGCASPLFFVLNGAWIAVIFTVIQLFTAGSLVERTPQLLAMMPYIAFINAGLGFNSARRARFLWLRMDLSRRGLFGLVERLGLRYSMLGWFSASALLMVWALIDRPELAPTLLLYFALQATVAVAIFYACLALTEGWSARDVALGIVMSVLMIAQMSITQPRRDLSTEAVKWALIVAVVLVIALRSYAAWRWRGLDWRLAKLSRASMGMRS
jgi:hypothetical protein